MGCDRSGGIDVFRSELSVEEVRGCRLALADHRRQARDVTGQLHRIEAIRLARRRVSARNTRCRDYGNFGICSFQCARESEPFRANLLDNSDRVQRRPALLRFRQSRVVRGCDGCHRRWRAARVGSSMAADAAFLPSPFGLSPDLGPELRFGASFLRAIRGRRGAGPTGDPDHSQPAVAALGSAPWLMVSHAPIPSRLEYHLRPAVRRGAFFCFGPGRMRQD